MNKICKECGGKCCKGFFIKMELTKELEKYFRAYRCVIVADGIFVPITCKFFNAAKGKCRVYNSERMPKICREYKCSYLGGKNLMPPIR